MSNIWGYAAIAALVAFLIWLDVRGKNIKKEEIELLPDPCEHNRLDTAYEQLKARLEAEQAKEEPHKWFLGLLEQKIDEAKAELKVRLRRQQQ